jgi:hypothetical protein
MGALPANSTKSSACTKPHKNLCTVASGCVGMCSQSAEILPPLCASHHCTLSFRYGDFRSYMHHNPPNRHVGHRPSSRHLGTLRYCGFICPSCRYQHRLSDPLSGMRIVDLFRSQAGSHSLRCPECGITTDFERSDVRLFDCGPERD